MKRGVSKEELVAFMDKYGFYGFELIEGELVFLVPGPDGLEGYGLNEFTHKRHAAMRREWKCLEKRMKGGRR